MKTYVSLNNKNTSMKTSHSDTQDLLFLKFTVALKLFFV